MKKLFTLLAIIVSCNAYSQGITSQGVPTSTIWTKGGMIVDSMFVFPIRDTVFPTSFNVILRKNGGAVIKNGLPYYYDGSKWLPFSVASIPFDSTYIYQALSDTAFSIRNDIGDSLNLKVYYLDSNIVYVTKYGLDTSRVTINSNINTRVKYTDTTAMLNPYLKKVDTASLSNRINLKLNISDTTAMLNPYLKKVDTTAMLNPYLKKVDTASLSNRINARVKYTDSITTFVTPTMLNDTANAIRNDFPILPSMYYQTVQANAVSATQRQRLNFGTQFSATDNGGNTSTDIAVTSIAQNIVVGLTDSLNTRVRYTDSLVKYVTPSQLKDSLVNNISGALTTNTTMSATLDTVKRNGINSSLLLGTLGARVNGAFTTNQDANINTIDIGLGGGSVYSNTRVGTSSLQSNSTGNYNTTQGFFSLNYNTNGSYNYSGGAIAGTFITGGVTPNSQTDNSVYIGANTKAQASGQTNQIVIGYDATGLGSNSAILGNSSISLTALRGSVLVNTTTDISCSQLTVESVSKGFLPPRMTTAQKNAIGSPTAGLLVYDLTLNKMCVYSTQWDTISTQNIIFGTGVQTALGINVGTVGSILVNGGALGTPSSGNGANITNIPQSGVTNLTSDLALKAPLASPSLTGTPTAPTAIAGTNTTQLATTAFVTTANATNANLTGVITSVGNATSIASQTGTGTKFVVDNSPTLITPNIGVATATSINTGTTLNGTIFAKSTNAVSLASSNHALTVGNEASGVNFAIGLYSTNCAIQARNNGTSQAFFINPLGGSVAIGDGAVTGQRLFSVINTGSGTTDWSSIEIRNGATASDALRLYCMGTNFTSSGMNKQDYGVLATGTSISGLSIGTQASAPIEFYTSNTQRWVLDASGNTIITGKFTSSGGGLGYSTGAGGTVTQATSRTTTVTLNKLCGTITMFSAAQAADTVVQFTLNNSFLEAGDYLMVQHIGKTPALVAGSWNFSVTVVAGSAVISVRNVSNSSITEATTIRFTIIKASTN